MMIISGKVYLLQKKFMKFRASIVLLFVFLFACKAKDSTPEEVESNLMNAMQTHLYSVINNDSSSIKYHVQSVVYYEDPEKYICEFMVHMKENQLDTTGKMKATISKDFKKVKRLY